MVLYDASCVWHLAANARRLPETSVANLSLTFAGGPVSTRAGPHPGKVRLPNGSDIPPVGLAFGSLYEREPDGKAPFFVLALLDIWRQNVKAAKDPRLPHTMLGVFSPRGRPYPAARGCRPPRRRAQAPVRPSPLTFAIKLAQLGKRYQLIVYADDIHEVANNRQDRDARIAAWFKQHQ
jgi:hypothetical protein